MAAVGRGDLVRGHRVPLPQGGTGCSALYVVVVAGYVASFAFLALVLRAGLPLGVAYGIWGALGVALTALLSALLFAEPLTALMGLGMVLIIGGVLLVELGSQRAHDRAVRAQERAQASGAGEVST